eukprot:4587573-Amphidinium_carterae.2
MMPWFWFPWPHANVNQMDRHPLLAPPCRQELNSAMEELEELIHSEDGCGEAITQIGMINH